MRSREDSEEISLKHSGYAYVYAGRVARRRRQWEGVTAWFDLLTRVMNTDLDTLLNRSRAASGDGGDLEDALRSAPAKVEVALLALRRGACPRTRRRDARARRNGVLAHPRGR
ncbi:hypothetical protein JL721_12502 [Aureococcus anophagefferens]|nr:hypothetical protein JL721_12502 [Aureococcus anophagefferens]